MREETGLRKEKFQGFGTLMYARSERILQENLSRELIGDRETTLEGIRGNEGSEMEAREESDRERKRPLLDSSHKL